MGHDWEREQAPRSIWGHGEQTALSKWLEWQAVTQTGGSERPRARGKAAAGEMRSRWKLTSRMPEQGGEASWPVTTCGTATHQGEEGTGSNPTGVTLEKGRWFYL